MILPSGHVRALANDQQSMLTLIMHKREEDWGVDGSGGCMGVSRLDRREINNKFGIWKCWRNEAKNLKKSFIIGVVIK